MKLQITPLKFYREWFHTLETDWANELSRSIIKDVLLTSSFFVKNNDDEAYAALELIDDFSAYLTGLIEENINVRNIDNERLLCQQLLSSTSYFFINFIQDDEEVYKVLQEKQMENLLLNNSERANFYEKSLRTNMENRLVAKELKLIWDKFTKEHFNIELFYQQEIS